MKARARCRMHVVRGWERGIGADWEVRPGSLVVPVWWPREMRESVRWGVL